MCFYVLPLQKIVSYKINSTPSKMVWYGLCVNILDGFFNFPFYRYVFDDSPLKRNFLEIEVGLKIVFMVSFRSCRTSFCSRTNGFWWSIHQYVFMWVLCPLSWKNGAFLTLYQFFCGDVSYLTLSCLLEFPPYGRVGPSHEILMGDYRFTIALDLHSIFHSESSSLWFYGCFFLVNLCTCECTTNLKFVEGSMNWSWSKKAQLVEKILSSN